MKRIVHHLIIPALLPVVFFGTAFTPVTVPGCLTRGLIAFSIALISGLGALSAAIMGAKGRVRDDPNAIGWLISTLIRVMPVIALILMA